MTLPAFITSLKPSERGEDERPSGNPLKIFASLPSRQWLLFLSGWAAWTIDACSLGAVIFGVFSDLGRKWPLVFNLIIVAILELGSRP